MKDLREFVDEINKLINSNEINSGIMDKYQIHIHQLIARLTFKIEALEKNQYLLDEIDSKIFKLTKLGVISYSNSTSPQRFMLIEIINNNTVSTIHTIQDLNALCEKYNISIK